ncbi:MAG: glycosyltransferase family 4 protein [Jaaginema sp. PMC 1079.18]|nr:glycosyltransferase family 4 protein [Jaaginema sp. PMC 1080.18]MEC4850299.1 glycosyltransferase family 4 protein [Jaaginema sp. PMC 1079.18]MEC4865869.1 glycosyltransferase family 4 protein [Jaaginema sp. PMC 1078.18]
MKILIYSPLFYPSIGGTETVTEILAEGFTKVGHEVKVICQTTVTPEAEKVFPFGIIRQPKPLEFVRLMGWCDVFFQGSVSLKGLWPLLLIRRPLVVTHHTWYRRPEGGLKLPDRLKRWVTYISTNIAISDAIAQNIPAPSTVIPNPYWSDRFYIMPEVARDRDLVFLGRLVSDKGADLLIAALAELQKYNLQPQLTIVGTGPEETSLRQQVREYNLEKQVEFIGVQTGEKLTKILNQHRLLVVPSRWQEPFGLVALEGIACGCVVIGSEGGGLKNAIAHCGVTFPNNDVLALSTILFDLLTHPQALQTYREAAATHLEKHQPETVVKSYLAVIEPLIP